MIVRLDAATAVLPDRVLEQPSLLVDDVAGTIIAVGTRAEIDLHPAGADARLENVTGTLVPGFVELQTNGAMGHDFRSPDSDGTARALAAILATGVTTCCPTIVTQPSDRYIASIRALSGAGSASPRIAGIHLEGPFLTPTYKGAHHEAWLQTPSVELVDRVLAETPVAIWTLAPELEGAPALIEHLVDAGVTVSAGHTGAEDTALDTAVDHGLTMVTHLGNGMPAFHHRRPGPVGWALAHPTVNVGVVIDGHHLHPRVLGLFRSLLGDRAFGVTDAIAAMGLPPGVYELHGMPLDTTTGVARVHGPDGTLAGATVGTDVMVQRLHASGVPLAELVQLCSTSPADAIGRTDLGRIAPGCRADLLDLDADATIRSIRLDGSLVHTAG